MRYLSVDQLIRAAASAYGRSGTMDYRFVVPRLRADPYRALRDELASKFEIGDDTDLNTDVSCVYRLMRGESQYVLFLSLVCRVAALLDVGRRGPDSVIPAGTRGSEAGEIVEATERYGVQLLDHATLTAMRRFPPNGNADRSIFSILMSDTDRLPWEA